MLPKDRTFIETMGSMIPNFYDFDQINQYYQCYDSCRNTGYVANCLNGGIPNPNNCGVCNCPMGYGGDLCDQRVSDSKLINFTVTISAGWMWNNVSGY